MSNKSRILVKEKKKANGKFWKSIIKNHVIFINFSKTKKSMKNSINFYLKKNTSIKIWSQNGRNKVMKNYAVYYAYKNPKAIFKIRVYVEYLKKIWKKIKWYNVVYVVVEVVLHVIK